MSFSRTAQLTLPERRELAKVLRKYVNREAERVAQYGVLQPGEHPWANRALACIDSWVKTGRSDNLFDSIVDEAIGWSD